MKILFFLYFLIKKKKLQFVFILLVSACSNTLEEEHPEVLDIILKQYPMYVNTSPDGNKILLKNRNEETFNILTSDIPTTVLDVIDSSKFSQLSLTWHPLENEIVFQEFNPKKRMYDLYKVNLDSKKRTLMELPASSNAIPPLRWSKSGHYLAYLVTNGPTTLYIYDYQKNEIIKSFPDMDPFSDFQWFNDSLFFFIRNPKKPKLEKINILTHETNDFDLLENGVVTADFSINENKVLFIGREHTKEYFQCYELNLENRRITEITTGNFNISSCRYSNNGSMYFYNQNENGVNRLYCSDSLLNNYFQNLTKNQGSLRIDLETENELYVTSHTFNLPPILLKINLKELKTDIEYQPSNAGYLRLEKPSFSEIEVPNSIFKTPVYFWKATSGKNIKKTVIYVHGGPHLQSKPLWNIRAKVLNENGFNLLSINYHGSSGYSVNFAQEKFESEQILDIISSIRFLKKEYDIDQKDIILMGSSYGGGLVLGASDYLDNLGGIVLLSGTIKHNIEDIERLKSRKIMGFYGKLDPLAKQAHNFFKENGLIHLETNNFKLFKNEGHFFHRSGSWARVYGAIIASFSATNELKTIKKGSYSDMKDSHLNTNNQI